MVEKTKRAISILQQRETHPIDHDSAADIRRLTEEKIAEFRRSAEEQVNQVGFKAQETFWWRAFFFLFFKRKKNLNDLSLFEQ